MRATTLLILALILIADRPADFHAQGSFPAALQQGRGFGSGPRDVRERPAGTAVIRGIIVTADTSSPIRRAQVRAVSAGSRDTRLVTSGADGRFELRDLPAGRWELSASKAGFVSMRYGQRRPFEAGRPIEVADGQVVQQANFSLPRGAAITGRVFDEFGDAVAGARVQAMRYQVVQGVRRLTSTGTTAQTDDTGAFRLFGLMPGDYYVSAVLRALPVDESSEAAGYAPTYFPGTGRAGDAQPVSLDVGQEAHITFGLMPVRMARISGMALSSTGMPLAGGTVMLMSSDLADAPPAAFGSGGRIRQDGTFAIPNVAPGSYALTAASGGFGRVGGGEFELGAVPVTVTGDEVTGVTVVTSRGATLSGTVGAAEGSGVRAPTAGLQVTSQAVPFERGAGARPARVESDGAFGLANLFGPRLIRVSGLPADWMLQAVVVGGRDVTDTPIDFGANQDITGARILLTNRVTEVSGSVSDASGRPARDYTIVVFAADEARWAFPSRHVRSARPDQGGRFRIRALPANDRYLAVAVDYLEEREDTDPEFLAWIRGRATSFRLDAGQTATLDLRLTER